MAWTPQARSRTATAAHRQWREQVLNRAARRCELREPGCIGVATEADHIIRTKLRPDLALDLDNGQAACRPCHTRKTQREATEGRAAARIPVRPISEGRPGAR